MYLATFPNVSPQFNSIFEPYTPIRKINAMTSSSSPPATWAKNGNITLMTDGVRKWFNFPPTTGVQNFSCTGVGQTVQYGTNGGATHIICVRMNSFPQYPSNPQSFTCPSGGGNGPPFTLTSNYTFGLYTPSYPNVGVPTTFVSGRNVFVFYALVMPLTQGNSNYLNGNYYTKGAFTPLGLTDATISLGNYIFKNSDQSGQMSFDLLYFAHYDRPLGTNQIKQIYNSITPLLDYGIQAPIYINPNPFVSLNVPATPVVHWNPFIYGFTNGASYNNNGSWMSNYYKSINVTVDSIGRNFVSFNDTGTIFSKTVTISPKLFTNGGMTFAFLMRVNTLANELFSPVKILSISGVADFYFSYVYPVGNGTLTNPLLIGLDENDGQGPADCYNCPKSAFNSYLGQFKLYVYTWSGTFSTLYVNNQIVGSAHLGNGLNSGADKTSFTTDVQFGLIYQSGLLGSTSYDVAYWGFWDRSLNNTEMTSLYSSCSMLLDP